MRLSPGTLAPTFQKNDVRGDALDLAEMLRSKPVWIGFFRFASCPLCNLRVHQMVGEFERFRQKCTFVAVFQSPANAFGAFLTKHTPPFPVIADPEMDLFRTYGVENSFVKAVLDPRGIPAGIRAMRAGFHNTPDPKHGAALRIPADFIIEPSGALKVARYGAFVSDSIPFDDAEKALS